MSRGSILLTSYIQAALFLGLGIRAVIGWLERRDRTSAMMAVATGLFGISQLISAVSSTIWDQNAGETPPRALGVVSGVITYIAIYAFMLFLAEFIKMPSGVYLTLNVFVIISTLFFIVMSIIEKPAIKIVNFKLVHLKVDNPIDYSTYIGIVLGYFALAFGVLWLAFFIYGLRVEGLARFRMLSIAGGFFLLFVAIGLLPRLLFGDPDSTTIKSTLTIVRYLALGCAPMLFLGFTPPAWITDRFGASAATKPQASASPPA